MMALKFTYADHDPKGNVNKYVRSSWLLKSGILPQIIVQNVLNLIRF